MKKKLNSENMSSHAPGEENSRSYNESISKKPNHDQCGIEAK